MRIFPQRLNTFCMFGTKGVVGQVGPLAITKVTYEIFTNLMRK